MRPAIASTLALAIGLGLAGCAMPAFDPVSAAKRTLGLEADGYPRIVARDIALAPHQGPSPREFDDRRVRDLVAGGETVLGLSASRNRIRLEDVTGCRSTRLLDWFSPSVAWENCGSSDNWHTARAKVGIRDSLYPLEVGAAGRYQRWATSHTGETSFRETECRVSDAVTLDLGRREADAFEVRCDDGRIERITWYAPGEGPVAYREAHLERGLREAWVVAD